MCSHTLSYLGLRESSLMPCLEQSIQELTFFTLDAFDLCTDGRAAQKSFDDLVMSFHVSPPSSGWLQCLDQTAVSFVIF